MGQHRAPYTQMLFGKTGSEEKVNKIVFIYIIKAYGWQGIELHFFLKFRLQMQLSDWLSLLAALLLVKYCSVFAEQDAGCSSLPVRTLCGTQKIIDSGGNGMKIPHFPARIQVTMLTNGGKCKSVAICAFCRILVREQLL